MKKMILATAVAISAGFFITANASIYRHKTDKGSRRLMRKERREERREQWLYSVSMSTENQFYTDFPNAKNVSWTEGAFSEANFNDAGVFKTAYYDQDQTLVGTTTVVDFPVLPGKAKDYIDKKYPGYSIEKVILFDDNEINETDMVMFNNVFNDEDNYFAVLKKGSKKIILKSIMDGRVSFFLNYK